MNINDDWWKCPRCNGKGCDKSGTRCGLCVGVGELSQMDWEQHCADLYWKFVESMAASQPLPEHSPIGGEHGHNR